MSITHRLLSLMNSELMVKSVYGEGSEFSFLLRQQIVGTEPMGDFAEAYRRSHARTWEYREKFTAPEARVLVVDDTDLNLKVFRGLLKQTKVQIDTADSGTDCLEMAKGKQYDIMFLDHRMPGMDGIETLEKWQMILAPLCPVSATSPDLPMISGDDLREAYETIREMITSFDYDSIMFVLESLEGYRLPETEQGRYKELRFSANKADWEALRRILAEPVH